MARGKAKMVIEEGGLNGLLGEENHYCWAFAIIVCF